MAYTVLKRPFTYLISDSKIIYSYLNYCLNYYFNTQNERAFYFKSNTHQSGIGSLNLE